MKMNIKGLVFVGFAAAVFASAANAASDKIVTSKTYVDGKIVQTLTEGDTTHAPSADKVRAELALKQDIHISDNTSDHGKTLIVGDTGDITISDVTAAGQQQADWDEATTTDPSYIVNKPTIAHAAADITGATSENEKELPTTYAVQQYVADSNADWDEATTTSPKYIENKPTITNAASGITNATGTGDNAKEVPSAYAVQQYMATNQANWTETTTTSPSYIQNKPGNFGGTDGTAAGTAGFVPAPAATDSGKVLGAGGTWVDMWTTPNGVNCSATNPCALVNAGSGPEWQYIQQ